MDKLSKDMCKRETGTIEIFPSASTLSFAAETSLTNKPSNDVSRLPSFGPLLSNVHTVLHNVDLDNDLYEKLCLNVEIVRKILEDLQPNALVDNNAAMIISFAIDDFLTSVGRNCYKYARHRGSKVLQLQDLYTHLDIEWRMPSCSLPPLPFDISLPFSPSGRHYKTINNDSSKYKHLISMLASKTRLMMNNILEQQTKHLHGEKIQQRHRVKTGKSNVNNVVIGSSPNVNSNEKSNSKMSNNKDVKEENLRSVTVNNSSNSNYGNYATLKEDHTHEKKKSNNLVNISDNKLDNFGKKEEENIVKKVSFPEAKEIKNEERKVKKQKKEELKEIKNLEKKE